MTSSIVLTCDAGIPVVLLGESTLANELGVVTEDLLANGAQVELVTGIERAPARLAEAVQRARTPTLFVLGRRGSSQNAHVLHALFEQVAGNEHRWLECDLEASGAIPAVRRITAALAELSRSQHDAEPTVPCDSAIDALFEDVASAADDTPAREVSGVVSLAEPRLLGPPKAPCDRPRRTRKASLFVALAAASTVVSIAAAWPRELPADRGGIDVELAPVAAVSARVEATTPVFVPQVPAPKPAPAASAAVEPEPARIAIPVPVLVPVIGTQDPSPPAAGDQRTQLDIAIERQQVIVHRGLVVAEAIMGERPWAEAMTACRARPFWHVRGWRVPTRKELVTLARAGLLPKARVWSATRGDRRSTTSFVVDGHDAAVSAEPRTDASAVTICVKRR